MSDFRSFFVNPNNIDNKEFFLDENESHHLRKVLRLKIHNEIYLIDGKGTAYRAIIEKISKEKVFGKILEVYPSFGEPFCDINLAIGVIKPSRMQWVLEKATECGVSNISPIQMDRSIKRSFNQERYKAIIKSSTKQCARSKIPYLYKPQSLSEWLTSQIDIPIIVCSQESKNKLSELRELLPSDCSRINLVIGPEGDFSDNEILLLNNYQSIFVSLGTRRLRTESAAVSAVSIINQILIRG